MSNLNGASATGYMTKQRGYVDVIKQLMLVHQPVHQYDVEHPMKTVSPHLLGRNIAPGRGAPGPPPPRSSCEG